MYVLDLNTVMQNITNILINSVYIRLGKTGRNMQNIYFFFKFGGLVHENAFFLDFANLRISLKKYPFFTKMSKK